MNLFSKHKEYIKDYQLNLWNMYIDHWIVKHGFHPTQTLTTWLLRANDRSNFKNFFFSKIYILIFIQVYLE